MHQDDMISVENTDSIESNRIPFLPSGLSKLCATL